MTAQTLYNQLNLGKITQEKFLYELRKSDNLPMITKFNSYKDTIQILKNKGIISEVKDVNPKFPQPEYQTIDTVSPYEYSKGLDYELDMFYTSIGQNIPTEKEVVAAQKKVLANLSKDKYYYTTKMMSDVEKKQEKENIRYSELKKEKNSPNQLDKGKVMKESFTPGENVVMINKNSDKSYKAIYVDSVNGMDRFKDSEGNWITTQGMGSNWEIKSLNENFDNCDCELDLDNLTPEQQQVVAEIVEEWGLTENDLEDDDVMEELENELYNRLDRDIEEAVVVKDKAGNIQYAKDDMEATNMMNSARAKGVQLTKSNI